MNGTNGESNVRYFPLALRKLQTVRFWCVNEAVEGTRQYLVDGDKRYLVSENVTGEYRMSKLDQLLIKSITERDPVWVQKFLSDTHEEPIVEQIDEL